MRGEFWKNFIVVTNEYINLYFHPMDKVWQFLSFSVTVFHKLKGQGKQSCKAERVGSFELFTENQTIKYKAQRFILLK